MSLLAWASGVAWRNPEAPEPDAIPGGVVSGVARRRGFALAYLAANLSSISAVDRVAVIVVITLIALLVAGVFGLPPFA